MKAFDILILGVVLVGGYLVYKKVSAGSATQKDATTTPSTWESITKGLASGLGTTVADYWGSGYNAESGTGVGNYGDPDALFGWP